MRRIKLRAKQKYENSFCYTFKRTHKQWPNNVQRVQRLNNNVQRLNNNQHFLR